MASRLAAKIHVAARIAVLTERATTIAAKKAGLTLADCIEEANIWVEDAKALGNTSAGVAATKLRAQLAGHLVEKREVKNTGPLDEADVGALSTMLVVAGEEIQRLKDAQALTGEVAAPPAPIRRVIG